MNTHIALAASLILSWVAAAAAQLKVTRSDDFIEIANGQVLWRLSTKGTALIDSITVGGNLVAKNGKLVCVLEDRCDYDKNHTTREQNFSSQIDSVTLEQS